MSFANDVGGMHGFGPVPVDARRRPAAPWSAGVWARNQLLIARGLYTFDDYRHAIERMPPAAYYAASGDERRLAAVETLVREHLAATEPAARRPVPLGPLPAPPARFTSGSGVVVRTDAPPVHSRTPRYVRGRRGVVEALRGRSVRPEDRAAGGPPQAQQIYSVRFDAYELWGRQGSPHCAVLLDLWEGALEPS